MATLTGTSGYDLLAGTDQADLIHGGGGDDWLKGRDGDDYLFGDAGNDLIVAGTGFDRLYGGSGDDQLISNLDGGVLSGGGGNDLLYVNHQGQHDDARLVLSGGGGDDEVYLSLYARFSDINVKAGAGDDLIRMFGNKGKLVVDLGPGGTDVIYIASRYGGGDGPAIVKHFDAGDGGDMIDISSAGALLDGGLVNYTEGDNPFATGHLRLVETAQGAVLECSGLGAGGYYHTLVEFRGVALEDLTAANFGGWEPFVV